MWYVLDRMDEQNIPYIKDVLAIMYDSDCEPSNACLLNLIDDYEWDSDKTSKDIVKKLYKLLEYNNKIAA